MGELYTVEQNRTWYNGLPGKRVSAALILRDGDCVLMAKDDYKPHWTFPGGAVDPREAPLVAAIRETQEEVGIQVASQDVSFFSVSYIPEHNGFMDRLHFFFITDAVARDTPVAPEAGIEGYEWVTIDRIGTISGARAEYVRLQSMLESGESEYYFEAQRVNESMEVNHVRS